MVALLPQHSCATCKDRPSSKPAEAKAIGVAVARLLDRSIHEQLYRRGSSKATYFNCTMFSLPELKIQLTEPSLAEFCDVYIRKAIPGIGSERGSGRPPALENVGGGAGEVLYGEV